MAFALVHYYDVITLILNTFQLRFNIETFASPQIYTYSFHRGAERRKRQEEILCGPQLNFDMDCLL